MRHPRSPRSTDDGLSPRAAAPSSAAPSPVSAVAGPPSRRRPPYAARAASTTARRCSPARTGTWSGRFSYGVTPGARAARCARPAAPARGSSSSSSRSSVSDKEAGEGRRLVARARATPPAELWQRQIAGMEGGWEVMADYQRWVLLRRMRSNRPVLEVMTEFWENHLNVPVNGDAQFTYRAPYGDVIREHALGQFSRPAAGRDHPPGDADLPRQGRRRPRQHPNENLGRELLECHTVGAGNYTEDDVKASARILTGWTVDMWDTWQALYDPEEHSRGPVRVMGFHDKNTHDGRPGPHPALPRLPRAPPGDRPPDRPEARGEVRPRRPVRTALVEHAGQGLPQATTPRSCRCCGRLVGSREFARSGRRQGARPRRGPRRDVPRPRHPAGPADGPTTPPPTHCSGRPAASASTRSRGRAPTASRSTTTRGPRPSRLLASMNVHFTMSGGWWPTRASHYREPQGLAAEGPRPLRRARRPPVPASCCTPALATAC